MGLEEYVAKRDFAKTREPRAVRKARKWTRPIFVVQLHHATRRHYDVRLQVGDVLMSWAVPKGPSFDPETKRMAVRTEDHPLGYEDFHGLMPKREYGQGHMAIFDRGHRTNNRTGVAVRALYQCMQADAASRCGFTPVLGC